MIRITLIACVLLPAAASALAQSYRSRHIRYIVGQAPGGSSDILARIIAQRVSHHIGLAFVMDNRPGATGIIGAEVVARATPDGYTLLQPATSHATNPTNK